MYPITPTMSTSRIVRAGTRAVFSHLLSSVLFSADNCQFRRVSAVVAGTAARRFRSLGASDQSPAMAATSASMSSVVVSKAHMRRTMSFSKGQSAKANVCRARAPPGGHPDEHDVRLNSLHDLDAVDTALSDRLGEAVREIQRHLVRAGGGVPPQVAFVQGVELCGEEAHLRRQLQIHLAQEAHSVADVGVEDDDRLGAEQAVLRPAQADDVDADRGRDIAESETEVGGGIAQTGAVDVGGSCRARAQWPRSPRSRPECRSCPIRLTGRCSRPAAAHCVRGRGR